MLNMLKKIQIFPTIINDQWVIMSPNENCDPAPAFMMGAASTTHFGGHGKALNIDYHKLVTIY